MQSSSGYGTSRVDQLFSFPTPCPATSSCCLLPAGTASSSATGTAPIAIPEGYPWGFVLWDLSLGISGSPLSGRATHATACLGNHHLSTLQLTHSKKIINLYINVHTLRVTEALAVVSTHQTLFPSNPRALHQQELSLAASRLRWLWLC